MSDPAAADSPGNPCTACGACCASFRVDFHPAELHGGAFAWEAGVPAAMALRVTEQIVRMAGTDEAQPRCIALAGEVGVCVSCTIYGARPSPCREFDISHDACARARARHGLLPVGAG